MRFSEENDVESDGYEKLCRSYEIVRDFFDQEKSLKSMKITQYFIEENQNLFYIKINGEYVTKKWSCGGFALSHRKKMDFSFTSRVEAEKYLKDEIIPYYKPTVKSKNDSAVTSQYLIPVRQYFIRKEAELKSSEDRSTTQDNYDYSTELVEFGETMDGGQTWAKRIWRKLTKVYW